MNSDKICWVIFFILISFGSYAQQPSGVEVKGVIIEEGNKEPIEQATVRLLNVKDSTFIGGVASSRNGAFSLKNIKPGHYLLHISYIGFDPLYQPLQVTGRRNPVDVGKLEMTDGTIRLGEAVVIGKAAEVVVRNDTIEYNADSYKVTEGSVLEDLLKKMPGVEVDSEGKITVNGKEISKILVDGKEFFSDDPKVASKNLPADMIDKIQTFEKRSDMARMTGFDDGEEENVINLTIKPGMKQGWFGNVFAGYGSEDRYEGNFMVNRFINNDQLTIMGGINNTNNMGSSDLASTMFSGMGGGGRRGMNNAGSGITTSGNLGLNFNKEFNPKLTLNGDIRYTHSDRDANSTSRTENILAADSSYFEDETNRNNTIGDTFAGNFRMEWKPDTMTTIIFRPDFNYSKSEDISDGHVYAYDIHDNGIYETIEDYYSKGESYNVNALLEYSHKLNSKGRVFSFSVSGGYSDQYNDGTNYSLTEYYQRTHGDTEELLDQQFRYENSGYNYRAYVSWVEPLGRNNFLQATYSFRQNRQESIKNTYSIDENGLYNVLDTTYSQSYENNFISQRASLSFRAQREKYNYLFGFNVDPSYSSSRNFVGDSTTSRLSRSVVNLSPMAQFNYMWDRRTNLRINYNGRTSQPSMTQLQPVRTVTSATNTTEGNPDLKPTYTNNFSVRFQKFMPEQQRAFMIMANANYVVNAITSKSTYAEDGSGKRLTTYENM
ncbi:MAG: outer membrane beta-barrel protein [Tannerellaceae bacterium]|nr:outer membrane beta-barrel protein [Tannerellaceae bacterium]